MNIGGVASGTSQAAQSVGLSVKVTKIAQDQQKKDGEAAVSLIRNAGHAQQTNQGHHKVDKLA